MANLTKRIIDLQTTSTLGSDDYVMVDGATNGTKKYLLKDILDEIEDIEDGTALGTGAVTTDKLAAGAVTNAKIDDGAVDTTNIADDAVTAAKIADGAVGTDAIAANAVTGAKIATGAVGTGNIASGAVTLDKIAADSNATSSRNGLMSSADKAKLDGFSAASNYALKSDIVGAYIFKGSVNTENDLPSTGLTVGDVYNIIAASSYGESGANVAWTGTAWDALGESFDISDGAIDTEQLANGAVTNDKLAEEAMTTISPTINAYTDPTYGSGTRQGYSVTFGNSDETALLPRVGSDLLIDVENIPTLPEKKIGSGAITANKIAAGAVGTEKLANSAVNTDKLATGAVSTDKIASLAVTTNKIAAGAVDNSKLANNAVGTAQIANGAVTSEKLGSDVTTTINSKAAASDVTALAEEVDTKADQEYVDEELEYKADIDGYYSQLTAGLAENLIGRGDAVPAEYLYRTAGGTADIEDGIATIDCIKGNTLVWNQLLKPRVGSVTAKGVTFTQNEDGTVTLNGTITESSYAFSWAVPNVAGHKYLLRGNGSDHSSAYFSSQTFGSDDNGLGVIITNTSANAIWYYPIGFRNTAVGTTLENVVFRPEVFDLTLMFGSGNEPETVEEFEAMFPLPYYPYSAPKLLPVDMRGVETVGFNLWDEEWEVGSIGTTGNITDATKIRSKNYIPVFPGQTYYVKSPNTLTFYGYDAQKNTITYEFNGYTTIGRTNATLTIPSGVHYLRFYMTGTTYNGDICINLSWSGYRNGEYEEHWSAERPIDTSRFFPTGLKKIDDKADALYADHYDTVIGAVDLGTLTWAAATAGSGIWLSTIVTMKIPATYAERMKGLLCAKYPPDTNASIDTNMHDKTMKRYNGSLGSVIVIRDTDYETAAAFKAAMSGVILYYELATPTTTEIDPPLNLSYKVSDFGTERIMVDETADVPQTAPVPMEVEYGLNAIDTIRRLPKEYQSHKSMGQFTAALESSLGIDITETWDEDDQRYEYEISELELVSTVASVTETDTETETTNTEQDVTQESGYYWNGTASSSSSYVYAHLTNLVEGDIITVEYGAYPYQLAWLRFVDAYSGSTRDASASGNYTTTVLSYTVPSGIDNVYVSTLSAAQPVFYVQRTTTTTTLMPKGVPELDESVSRISQWVSSDHSVSASSQSLASGETLTVAERIDNKKNCTYEVWAEFGTFDTLTIGHGIGAGIAGSWIVIDGTNMTAYYFNGSTTYSYGPWAHGLTISDFLQVSIKQPNVNPAQQATVTLMTSSGSFTQSGIAFAGCNGNVTVSATMDVTDVKASYIINDMLFDVYLFGDSYVGLDAARYPYHLLDRGANDLLISGFSGARSEDEIVSLENILQVHKPKYVVWALGMNNRDNNDSYNNGWKHVLDVVLRECDKYGIVPILATIPNTPTVSNVYKNAWVRQSGYRYVDFAKAVGAEEADSTWYAGMLSSDNVHPTELGAKALAARFLIDVPEVL